jgi:hypothetical protein
MNVAILLGFTGALTLVSQRGLDSDVYPESYFGEPLKGLTPSEIASFDRGFLLFVKRWEVDDNFSRNAESCVSCHSVPMPGGSGMSEQAEVTVSESDSHTYVVQKKDPTGSVISSSSLRQRRTPPLFGIGFLEHAKAREVDNFNIFGALAEEHSLEIFVGKALAIELGVSNTAFCARRSNIDVFPMSCPPKASADNPFEQYGA